MSYETVILASWATFLLVWAVTALGAKRDIKGGSFASWWSRFFLVRVAVGALVVYVALRVATGSAHYTDHALLSQSLFTPPAFLGWVGAVLAVLGVALAVWARIHLGRNWSASPAVKENHELVTSGPYRFVRHPIYTGVLLAGLGATLAGNYFALAVLALGSVLFYLRIDKEEKIMLELFPNQYPEYRKRTWALIPWVW